MESFVRISATRNSFFANLLSSATRGVNKVDACSG